MSTKTKAKNTVSILSKAANIAAAIQAVLTPRLPTSEFKTVSKYSEIPADQGETTIASLGFPTYIPSDRVTTVIAVNTQYVEDPAVRNAQWEMLRNENTPTEDIIEILGGADTYTVIPSKRAVAVRADFAEARADFAEAETPEDKLEAMTKMRDLAISVSALK